MHDTPSVIIVNQYLKGKKKEGKKKTGEENEAQTHISGAMMSMITQFVCLRIEIYQISWGLSLVRLSLKGAGLLSLISDRWRLCVGRSKW